MDEGSFHATISGSRSSLSDSARENAKALAESKRELEVPPETGWEALRVFMVSSLRNFAWPFPSPGGPGQPTDKAWDSVLILSTITC